MELGMVGLGRNRREHDATPGAWQPPRGRLRSETRGTQAHRGQGAGSSASLEALVAGFGRR
jgi:hypothetical protein